MLLIAAERPATTTLKTPGYSSHISFDVYQTDYTEPALGSDTDVLHVVFSGGCVVAIVH